MNTTTTPEQIDRCERVIDVTHHQVFYLVESLSEPGTFYKVIYNHQYRVLQCLPHNGRACPAAAAGNTCWHRKAAVAAEQEYQALKAAERKAQERIEQERQYHREQAEQALYTAQLNLAQERNRTTQCADGSWW
jgi:hypothetical protein